MKTILFSLVFMLFCLQSFSQVEKKEADSLVLVTLNNGMTRIGVVLKDDGREILLQTKELGNIYISKSQIISISPIDPREVKTVAGELRESGPFTTRYYFTTNSLPIKKGENYAMVHLFGPEVHFAASDRLSIGVMSTWIASPFIVAGKYTFKTKNDKLNFGIGTLAGTSGYLNNFRGFGALHWGMMTYGDRMNNITIGAGLTYVNPGSKKTRIEYEQGSYAAYEYSVGGNVGYGYPNIPYKKVIPRTATNFYPTISVGGITKIGKKTSLFMDFLLITGESRIIENNQQIDQYYRADNQLSHVVVGDTYYSSRSNYTTLGIFMPGMRFQKSSNRAFQVALAGVMTSFNGNVTTFPLPMVNWFFKF